MAYVCMRCHQRQDIPPETPRCPRCKLERPEAGWTPLPGLWRPGLWLQRRIAVGGMGAVYEGYEQPARGPQQRVAVKFPLLVDLTERASSKVGQTTLARTLLAQEKERASQFIKDYKHEAAACYHLESIKEDVVQVFQSSSHEPPWARTPDSDLGSLDWLDDPPYMVMEYVDGWTVLDVLTPRRPPEAERENSLRQPVRLPPFRAARLLEALARAVAQVHDHDVVHRDIKPANLFVVREAPEQTDWYRPGVALKVKVCDLGLARIGRPHPNRPRTADSTPPYAPPEQFEDALGVGPEADTYALGVILYEALAGRRPFRAAVNSAEAWVLVHRERPLQPISEAAVPPELWRILERSLRVTPQERYRAAELADALRMFCDNEEKRFAAQLEQFRRQCAGIEDRLEALKAQLTTHEQLVAEVNGVLGRVQQAPTSAAALADSDWAGELPDLGSTLRSLEERAAQLLGSSGRPTASSGRGRWLALGGLAGLVGGAALSTALLLGLPDPPPRLPERQADGGAQTATEAQPGTTTRDEARSRDAGVVGPRTVTLRSVPLPARLRLIEEAPDEGNRPRRIQECPTTPCPVELPAHPFRLESELAEFQLQEPLRFGSAQELLDRAEGGMFEVRHVPLPPPAR